MTSQWKPVENREYTMPGFAPGYTYTLRVDDGNLEAWSNDFDNKHQDGSPRHVEEIGIGEWRLCQLVTTEDAAPCVPADVLEALRVVLYGESATGGDYDSAFKVVTVWFEGVRGGDDE